MNTDRKKDTKKARPPGSGAVAFRSSSGHAKETIEILIEEFPLHGGSTAS